MAITVVQTLSVQQSVTGSFAANITAGNSIVIALSAFTTAGATISSSNPTFNGVSVAGAVLGIHNQSSTSGNNVYGAIWLLPNLAGGAKLIAYTVTNGGTATAVGFTAWEVAGLGASPSFDQVSPLTGKGTSGTTLSSGATPAITAAPEFIAAVACSFGNAITKAGAPWTEVNSAGGTDTDQGQQIVTSSGGTFTFAPVAAGSADWVSMVATIKGTAAAGVTQAASGSVTRGRSGRRGTSAGSPRPLLRIEEIPPVPSGTAVRGKPGRKGTSAGSPRPLLHIEENIPASGRAVTGKPARKGTSAGSPRPLLHIEEIPPVPSGTAVRGKPARKGTSSGSKPVAVAAAAPPVIQPPAATGRAVTGKRARKGTSAGSPAPLLHIEEIPQPQGRAVTGKRARKGTSAGSPPPLVRPGHTPQPAAGTTVRGKPGRKGTSGGSRPPQATPPERIELLPLGRAVTGRKGRKGAAAGSKPIPVRAAPPVTVVSPLSGNIEITNALAGTIEITNALAGSVTVSNELGGSAWQ